MRKITRRFQIGLATAIALVSLGVAGAWDRFSGGTAEAEAPVKFAASMPAGALVYLEARDLQGLLKAWMASPVRDRYFQSKSYTSFTRSRLYLKIQDRLNDLQTGFGVDLTDEWLSSVAGGPSAIAIYDPSKLEMLLVTEVPRERALASTVFAQAKSFQERKTAKGVPYYSREVATDGGTGSQRIAFAWSDGKFWIGSSDALLAEALDGPANGGLGAAVAQTARAAGDVATHDLVLWFDMERSVRNKYFNLYWVQRNAKDLEGIANGLIDLEFAADGVHERRWYVRKGGGSEIATTDSAALGQLAAAAPADAQFVVASASTADIGATIASTMFGPDREGSGVGAVQVSSQGSYDDASDEASNSGSSSQRYRYLDERFDRDIDDQSAAAPKPPATGVTTPKPTLSDDIAKVVGDASPVRTAVFEGIQLANKELFARVDRTVVVELSAPDRLNTSELERLVRAEFARRFVVGGNVERVSWVASGGSRALAGSLSSQGGAYRLVGRYLVVAATPALCDGVAGRLAQPAASAKALEREAGLSRVAEVRLDQARGPFTRLTRILDTRQTQTVEEDVAQDEVSSEEDSGPVLFFSENISSLLDVARDVTTVRIVTTADAAVIRERVDYLWAVAPTAKAGAPS